MIKLFIILKTPEIQKPTNAFLKKKRKYNLRMLLKQKRPFTSGTEYILWITG